MPIKQDRILKLIELYELDHERREILKTQFRAIHIAAETAHLDEDHAEVIRCFNSLKYYIDLVVDFRKEEYDAFMAEKNNFIKHEAHNTRSKFNMASLRQRRAQAHVGDYDNMDHACIELAKKLILDYQDGMPPYTAANLKWTANQPLETIRRVMIPHMIDSGLLQQVEGGYIPIKPGEEIST